jgi:transposase
VPKANQLLNGLQPETDAERHTVLIAREIIEDIIELDARLAASKARVHAAAAASGTCLCDIVGVGPIVAATIIGYTPDIARFPTRAAFAAYNGTAPIEVSSGGRTRHRLNRRGNRQLNFAIHIAAVVQVRTGGQGSRRRGVRAADRSR